MESGYAPRRKTKKRKMLRLAMMLTFGFITIAAALAGRLFWAEIQPNNDYITPSFAVDKPIFYRGQMLGQQAVGEKDGLKLPLGVLQEHFDPNIVFESETDSVIVTTDDKVLRMKTDQLTGLMNEKPITLRFTVDHINNIIYVPVEPLLELFPVQITEDEQTGAVFIQKAGEVITWGKAIRDPKLESGKKDDKPVTVPLRKEPSIQAPIYVDLSIGDRVMIWNESDGWYEVQLPNGYTGYVDKSNLAMDGTDTSAVPVQKNAFVPWKPLGGKVNLTWEQVTQYGRSDTKAIGEMPGLNVVSPTWFHLKDSEGNLTNLADPSYVKWAHDRGYQIWALFSNNFDPDMTSEALSTYDRRMKMIKQLLGFAELYNLQGINIDFENVYLKDQSKVTQFVRELTPLLHEQGLVVSMDVTIRGGSEQWSLFYDRRELAKVIDYMMVMTYDEHWASSPVAGSVASLPWVEKGIVDIMKEDDVPASKLLLGVPYYTRLWTEETAGGKTKVTSKALFMSGVEKIIKVKNLTPVYRDKEKQNYVEYKEGGKTYKIWIEDETSMRSRAELVKKYDLAGIASWRRGYEQPGIWNVIQETLEKRP